MTGPLTVGLTYIDNSSSSASLGVSNPSTVTNQTIAEAFVHGFNAAGGLHDRKLKLIEYKFNGNATNYGTEATTACVKFTQDYHVSVVLDNAFGGTGGFRDCLAKAGVLDITNQYEGNTASSSKAPLHANTMSMTTDRTYSAVLTQLVSTGYLSNKNQLGVIIENCPEDSAAYSTTLLPLIGRLGLKKPQETRIDCTVGFSSAAPAASRISGAVLAFRRAGVDRVMIVSYEESVALLFFAQTADSQKYFPGYALSSSAQAQALRSSIPKGQWPQLNGAGNSAFGDVDGSTPTPVDARCLRVTKAGGISPGSYANTHAILYECGTFLLLEAALGKTNGNSGAGDLAAAIASLGTGFSGPDLVGSATKFTSTRHDGPNMTQVFGYVAACTCIRYRGNPAIAPA